MTEHQLIGKKIFLRQPLRSDLKEVIALNKSSVSLHRGLASPPKTELAFENFLRRTEREDVLCFLICRREDECIVGLINLSQIFRGPFQNAYLGYYIGQPFANRGYMTEAIHLVLRHAFKTLKLHRLEANIQPGNKASLALVRRAGFTKEGYSRRYLKIGGRWRDHERWAITVKTGKRKSLKLQRGEKVELERPPLLLIGD